MEDAREQLSLRIRNGEGLEKLRGIIRAQGGNPAVCDNTGLLRMPWLSRRFRRTGTDMSIRWILPVWETRSSGSGAAAFQGSADRSGAA
jgi:hypothetical protein